MKTYNYAKLTICCLFFAQFCPNITFGVKNTEDSKTLLKLTKERIKNYKIEIEEFSSLVKTKIDSINNEIVILKSNKSKKIENLEGKSPKYYYNRLSEILNKIDSYFEISEIINKKLPAKIEETEKFLEDKQKKIYKKGKGDDIFNDIENLKAYISVCKTNFARENEEVKEIISEYTKLKTPEMETLFEKFNKNINLFNVFDVYGFLDNLRSLKSFISIIENDANKKESTFYNRWTNYFVSFFKSSYLLKYIKEFKKSCKNILSGDELFVEELVSYREKSVEFAKKIDLFEKNNKEFFSYVNNKNLTISNIDLSNYVNIEMIKIIQDFSLLLTDFAYLSSNIKLITYTKNLLEIKDIKSHFEKQKDFHFANSLIDQQIMIKIIEEIVKNLNSQSEKLELILEKNIFKGFKNIYKSFKFSDKTKAYSDKNKSNNSKLEIEIRNLVKLLNNHEIEKEYNNLMNYF